MHPPNPLQSTCLNGFGSRAEVAVDTASGGVQPSDKVCELADASVSFKSDMWKYFGLPRRKKWEGDGQLNLRQALLD